MANLVRRNMLPNRGFEDFYNMIDSFFNDDFTPQRAINTASFKVDIVEDENEYRVEAEMPGFEKEDINIEFDDGRLTLSAEHSEEKNEEEKNYIHKERKSSRVSRRMFFKDVDGEGIKASLDKGILKIEVPKKKELQTSKSIKID